MVETPALTPQLQLKNRRTLLLCRLCSLDPHLGICITSFPNPSINPSAICPPVDKSILSQNSLVTTATHRTGGHPYAANVTAPTESELMDSSGLLDFSSDNKEEGKNEEIVPPIKKKRRGGKKKASSPLIREKTKREERIQ